MRCGKCKGEHDSAGEVRRCYGFTDGRVVPPDAPPPQGDLPVGRYAVPSRSADRDFDFYRIDRPDRGKWAGYTFAKTVVGGKPDFNVRGRRATQDVISRIFEYGVDKAAYEYGQKIGECDKCGKHLTDQVSRANSRGPDCRRKYGVNPFASAAA